MTATVGANAASVRLAGSGVTVTPAAATDTVGAKVARARDATPGVTLWWSDAVTVGASGERVNVTTSGVTNL